MKLLNKTYRIFAIVMAFMMFATSVNIAVDMHYCQGKLQAIGIFGDAPSCYDMVESNASACPNNEKMSVASDGTSIQRKDCCNNRMVHIQSNQTQSITTSEILTNPKLQQFVVALVTVFFQNKVVEKTASIFQYYHPPIVLKDISVLYESFLL